MNFFETKKVKLYKHLNDLESNHYGETFPELDYICDLIVDIQPASAKLLEKEFGMVNEATYILWAETAPNKKLVIDKDTYVKFEYEDYSNTYQVVDRSRWLGTDTVFDDYTCFSVKLVDNYKEKDMTNRPLIGKLSSNTLTGKLNNENFKIEEEVEVPDEKEDDYYG